MEHTASRPGVRICPLCETGELHSHEAMARCGYCDRLIEKAVLRTIEQITALSDALGAHACECGHPEMRRLPDGVFHCPACGSEVMPVQANFGASETGERRESIKEAA